LYLLQNKTSTIEPLSNQFNKPLNARPPASQKVNKEKAKENIEKIENNENNLFNI